MQFLKSLIGFFFSLRPSEVQNSVQLAVRSTSLRELDRLTRGRTRCC